MMIVNFTMVVLGFTRNVQPNLRLNKHPPKVGGFNNILFNKVFCPPLPFSDIQR